MNKFNKNQKGFAPIIILVGVLLAVLAARGIFMLGNSQLPNHPNRKII
jgi:flagellar basal body-associated protein FliL